MHKVLILGGGKIGSLLAAMLAGHDDYEVTVADAAGDASEAHGASRVSVETLDATDQKALTALVRDRKSDAIVSSLPFSATRRSLKWHGKPEPTISISPRM